MKRRMRYAPPRGPVAISPKAWGEEFEIVLLDDGAPEPPYSEAGAYAVVDICGPLSQHPGFFGDSYDAIRERVSAALDSSQPAVCLRINSPGGDWTGALELARELRAMAKAKGKRLAAFTDSMALSAGYAIACAAETITATESASVGSIGVWAPMIDLTMQDAMYGVGVYIAASGTAKADRNPHMGITDVAFSRLQAQVDEQAAIFFELVAEFRGLSATKIKALEGAELFGVRALASGLTDALTGSWSEFLKTEGASMATKASKYDEAIGALQRAAEEDSEDGKKAKKLLKAMEDEEKPEDEKDKDKDEKAQAAGEDEKDKEKEKEKEKARAAADEKEKEKAKALSENSLAMARELQEVKAKIAATEAAAAAKAEADTRADLLAKRPDFGPEQRATLALASLDVLKNAVETWPRAKAGPHSAAAAMVPEVSGGERRNTYQPHLSAEEQDMLARSDPDRSPSATFGATMQGSTMQLPVYDKETAKKRLAAIKAEREAV